MINVLNIENLCFSYGNTPVFTNLNFSIQKGDFVAIVGQNGTGKTTLLKLILGELKNKQGEISVFNNNVGVFKDWHKIGYISQNEVSKHADFPATVEEIVTAHMYKEIGLFCFANKTHKARAYEALQMVGMEDYFKTQISKLSGGQQQRVFLASVLVSKPELMLLDEPTTGIDDTAVKSLYELLKKINKETGVTILMITHDVFRACNYVSRTFRLEGGSLTEI